LALALAWLGEAQSQSANRADFAAQWGEDIDFMVKGLTARGMTIDLARANKPWILYWDYTQKYATNPILDTLRKKPFEGRVVAPSFLVDPRALPPEKRLAQYFPNIYGIEW
jgi:hypothetical protein